MTPADLPPEVTGPAADHVLALVADAQARQSAALDAAIDGGMRHLPRLLRGPVKAVLFR